MLHLAQFPLATFVGAALGLVPLAAMLGRATRSLALRLGPMPAALLQATFGNASELILALAALHAGLLQVVKASLTGSIIGNLLLVLGLAMLLGGRGRPKQKFNRELASTHATMLFLAVIGLVVPAVFAFAVYGHLAAASPVVYRLSLWTAAILITVYIASLRFQLSLSHAPSPSAAPIRGALAKLVVATLGIVFLSEVLVGQLQAAKLAFHGTDLFWGGIVFALIGNVAEQGTALAAARHDEMDLAISIGLGSSLQIALLVAPLTVFLSFLLHHPMTLVFNLIEIVAIAVSVLMVALIAGDGESNWFEGVQLLAVYALLAVAFYFVPALT